MSTTKFKEIQTSAELLNSFVQGPGNTSDLAKIASIDGNTLKYDGLAADVTPAWKDAKLLSYIHLDLKDRKPEQQEKLFVAFNNGQLSLHHRDGQTETKPLLGHVLTSEQYLHNNFKLTANAENIEQIYNLISDIKTSITKTDLLTIAESIKAIILPEKSEQTYLEMVRKEEENKIKFAALETLITDIVSSGNLTTGSVAVADISEAIDLLTKNGFELTTQPALDMTTMTNFTISFKEISEESNI